LEVQSSIYLLESVKEDFKENSKEPDMSRYHTRSQMTDDLAEGPANVSENQRNINPLLDQNVQNVQENNIAPPAGVQQAMMMYPPMPYPPGLGHPYGGFSPFMERPPVLTNGSLESILRFQKEYQRYEMTSIGQHRLPMHSLIEPMTKMNLLEDLGRADEDISIMTQPQLLDLLFSTHQARSLTAWEASVKKIRMTTSSLVSFRKYAEDFQQAVRIAGPAKAPREEYIAQMFIQGILPTDFQKDLSKRDFRSVLAAKEACLSVLQPYWDTMTNLGITQIRGMDPYYRTDNGPNRPPMAAKPGGDPSRTEPHQGRTETRPPIRCFNCFEVGHLAPQCTNKRHPNSHYHKKEPDRAVRSMWRCHSGEMGTSTVRNGIRAECQVRPVESGTGSIDTTCFCDTGANINTVTRQFVEQFKNVTIIHEGPTVVRLVGKQQLSVTGDLVKLQLTIYTAVGETVVTDEFVVLEDCDEDISIGMGMLEQLFGVHPILDNMLGKRKEPPAPEEEVEVPEPRIFPEAPSSFPEITISEDFPLVKELKEVIQKYGPVLFSAFDSEGLRVEPMDLKVQAGLSLEMQPCRFIQPGLLQQVREEIDRLEHWKVLEKAEGIESASPLVVVPKPDGKIRLAVDYRQLNQIIHPTAHQLPFQQTLFECLAGNRYYAKLDNLYGYHQLPLTENAQKLCSIITPFGIYKMRMLGFGISTAPGIYQQRMQDVILKDYYLKGCVVYIDDTIVYGKTPEEFLKNLDNVLAAMARFNVRLKPAKCSFGGQEVVFLGHRIAEKEYGLTMDRKQSILNMALPSTVTHVRSFVGMANFFRNFVPSLSTVMGPLTDLTKGTKKGKIQWTEEADVAFQRTKEAILNATELAWINETDQLILYTDASDVGIGAVLVQVQDEVEKPIRFLSQKLSDVASRWTVTEKECYALFYAVTQLQFFLLGRKFYIKMDHRNLVYLYNSSVNKLIRWRLRLQEYNFVIIHIPGATNIVADTLSRAFGLRGGEVEMESDLQTADTEEIQRKFQEVHNEIMGHHGIKKTMELL
jgi:hypothetical protein